MMEYLNWLSTDKNWVVVLVLIAAVGWAIEGIVSAWRGKND